VEDNEHKQETLIIVYGVNKPLEVERTETIGRVKLGGMALFAIPVRKIIP